MRTDDSSATGKEKGKSTRATKESPLYWLEFDYNDWLKSDFVGDLTDGAYRAYHMLLLHQFKEGVLPKEIPALARRAGMDLARFRRAWPSIADRFEPVDGGLQNPKMAEKRERALMLTNAKSAAASAAAIARWEKEKGQPTLSGTMRDAMQAHSERSADAMPDGVQYAAPDAMRTAMQQRTYKEIPLIENGRADSFVIEHGGPIAKDEGPVVRVLRDSEDRQEWVSADGDHWVRALGVSSNRGPWGGSDGGR